MALSRACTMQKIEEHVGNKSNTNVILVLSN